MAEIPGSTAVLDAPATPTETPPAAGLVAPAVPASPSYTALDWRSGLPPDLQAEGSIKDYQDVPSLARALVETKKMVGGMARIPKDDAAPEEWDKYYDRAGRPKSPTDYTLALPGELEGQPYWGPGIETTLRTVAHEAGLNQRQAQTMVERLANFLGQGHNEAAAAKAEQGAKVQQELAQLWGAAKPQKLALAQQAVRKFAEGDDGPEILAYLETTGLGNHPGLIKMFARVGALLPEDTLVDSAYGPMPSLDELTGQIAEANAAITTHMRAGGSALQAAQAKMRTLQQQRAALQERAAAQQTGRVRR